MSLLVTFHSVGGALHARMLLEKQGAACTVAPVPRSVSSSCGYALETADMPPAALAGTMDGAGIEWDALYRTAEDGGKELYKTVLRREE